MERKKSFFFPEKTFGNVRFPENTVDFSADFHSLRKSPAIHPKSDKNMTQYFQILWFYYYDFLQPNTKNVAKKCDKKKSNASKTAHFFFKSYDSLQFRE